MYIDLYCYVGSWSLFASKYSAHHVIGVDSSQNAIQFAKSNADLNNISNITWIHSKVKPIWKKFLQENRKFGMIILDPPSFSASSPKTRDAATRKWIKILQDVIELVEDGGILISCSCSYHLSREYHMLAIQNAAKRIGRNVCLIHRGYLLF